MNKTKLSVFLVLFFSFLFIKCEDGTEPKTKQAEIFQIHLQTEFKNNYVRVKFDQENVFDDTVSTNSNMSYAAIISLDVSQGQHYIQVLVDNDIQGDTTLIVGDSLYVLVRFDNSKKIIDFSTRKKPFPYR